MCPQKASSWFMQFFDVSLMDFSDLSVQNCLHLCTSFTVTFVTTQKLHFLSQEMQPRCTSVLEFFTNNVTQSNRETLQKKHGNFCRIVSGMTSCLFICQLFMDPGFTLQGLSE